MELREYIAARRKELGLTQNEIAAAIGYSETAISKIESGDSLPPISILPALADRLHLSLNDLLTMKENPESLAGKNPPYNWRVVSSNLRAVRLAHHLKQREAALKIGINKRTLITYEKGDACPNWDALRRILPLCPGDPVDLFYGNLYPEIQASPLFRKRGSLPFFVFLCGVLFGGGVLSLVLLPFSAHPQTEDSTASTSAPFNNGSSSADSSSSSEDSSSSSSSSSGGPSAVVKDLDELVVVGPDGGSLEEPMKCPTSVDPVIQYQVSLYTGLSLFPAERQSVQFSFSIINAMSFPFNKDPFDADVTQPSHITITGFHTWASGAVSATIEATYHESDSDHLAINDIFMVYAIARNSPTTENPNPTATSYQDCVPLNINLTASGQFENS